MSQDNGETPDGGGTGGTTVVVRDEVRREVIGQLRSALNSSELVQRHKFAGMAGLQYDTDSGRAARDVWKVAGYPEEYTFAHGWSRYKRQDICRRGVDLPCQKTWRHVPGPVDGSDPETDPDDTDFCTAWTELWTALRMQSVVERADRMGAIGEFSVILLGLPAEDQRALREPVEPGTLDGPQDVAYAKPFKQADVEINTLVGDHESPRFGYPETYRIDIGAGGKGRSRAGAVASKSIIAHWTRVLHIVEDPLDSDVYGMPRLERALNRLMDLEKVCAATGEAFWQLAAKILTATVDPKAPMDDDTFDALDEGLEEIVHDLRRHWMAQGVTLDYLGGDTPDPSSPADLYLMLLAACWGIPKRILFGSETGERASSEDERAMRAIIGERIEQYAEPMVVRQFTDRMVALGALPVPRGGPDVYSFRWPDLYEATDEERADADLTRAETAKALTPLGGEPLDVAEVTKEGRVVLKPTGQAA